MKRLRDRLFDRIFFLVLVIAVGAMAMGALTAAFTILYTKLNNAG